jgi:quercetin dioxygenase-like cupin family protein
MRDPKAVHTCWADVRLERLRGSMERRFITTDNLMLAQIHFKRADVVPRHRHVNEQVTYVVDGVLEFWFGDADEQHIIVRAGEVVSIPSQLSHRAVALEDTFELDIFNPPRQDWIDGTDAYLRS